MAELALLQLGAAEPDTLGLTHPSITPNSHWHIPCCTCVDSTEVYMEGCSYVQWSPITTCTGIASPLRSSLCYRRLGRSPDEIPLPSLHQQL